jgi:hypothetical protein
MIKSRGRYLGVWVFGGGHGFIVLCFDYAVASGLGRYLVTVYTTMYLTPTSAAISRLLHPAAYRS